MPSGPSISSACGKRAPAPRSSRSVAASHGRPGGNGGRPDERCWSSSLTERFDDGSEVRAHGLERPIRRDHAKPRRLGRGACEIGVAHAREERALLALELVEHAAVALVPRETTARYLDRNVEQQREVRLAVAMHPHFELGDERAVDAVPAALVGMRRVGEAVAQHPVAARERRPDHVLDVFAPRREHQQRLGVVGHRLRQQ